MPLFAGSDAGASKTLIKVPGLPLPLSVKRLKVTVCAIRTVLLSWAVRLIIVLGCRR
jgi:hypothetical protein